MIKLIALDFDNTIAARKQPVDGTMAAYFKKWRDKGIRVVVASGRPYRSLKRELAQVELDFPVISNNGNLIRMKDSEQTLFKNTFPTDAIRPIAEAMIARDIHPIFHVDGYDQGYDLVTLFPQTEREAGYISFYENLYRKLSLEEALREDVLVIAGYTTKEVYDDLIQEPVFQREELTPHLLKSVDKHLSLFEIIGNSDKWHGLEVLSASLSIPKEAILTAGDDMNDLSMVREAGIGIAMDSAPDAVKEVSDRVCKVPPEELGIFKLVEGILNEESGYEY